MALILIMLVSVFIDPNLFKIITVTISAIIMFNTPISYIFNLSLQLKASKYYKDRLKKIAIRYLDLKRKHMQIFLHLQLLCQSVGTLDLYSGS